MGSEGPHMGSECPESSQRGSHRASIGNDYTLSAGFESVLTQLSDLCAQLENQHRHEIVELKNENEELKFALKQIQQKVLKNEVVDVDVLQDAMQSASGFTTSTLGKCSNDDVFLDDIVLKECPVEERRPSTRVRASVDGTEDDRKSQLSSGSRKTRISKDSFIGQSTLPVEKLRRGYSHSTSGLSIDIPAPPHADLLTCEAEGAYTEQSIPRRPIIRFWMKDIWVKHLEYAVEFAHDSLSQHVMKIETSKSESSQTTGLTKLSRYSADHAFGLKRCILLPFSIPRIVWGLLSMIFLASDFVMTPIDICFDVTQGTFIDVLQFSARIFWTIDIPVNFCSALLIEGDVVDDPSKIARNYLRTWFPLDVFMVTIEWAVITVESANSGSAVSVVRTVRWVRVLRVMRLLRLVRLTKLKPLLFDLMRYSSDDFKVFIIVLGWSLCLIGGAHIFACLWHLLGDQIHDGWVSRMDLVSASVNYKYALSLQYVYARLHGASSQIYAESIFEVSIDAAIIISSLIAVSFYIGLVTHAVDCWSTSDAAQLKNLANQYVRRHQISLAASARTQNYLSACQVQGVGETLAHEKRLLSVLPIPLQEDLQYEARTPYICVTPFFKDLRSLNPRVLRHVCHEATIDLMAVEGEVVFATGDPCFRVLFVSSGLMVYEYMDYSVQVFKGCCLSEASLWTHWENVGTLKTLHDCLLLSLDSFQFSQVIVSHIGACGHAVKYARLFVYHLNDHREQFSDTMIFDGLVYDNLDCPGMDIEFNHFMFLSHYKNEAGTEATLMRDALETLLRADPSFLDFQYHSPVFVDSENLEDLPSLKKHIEGSAALVVLLTPGLLKRPWCLLEFLFAQARGVRFVPVEIQRPGMKYVYPDEEFYRRLVDGQVLKRDAKKILEDEGYSLLDAATAIRHVFQRIALPFSPHKSWNVRHAELSDILGRCSAGKNAVQNSYKSASASTFSPAKSFSRANSDPKMFKRTGQVDWSLES